MARQAHSALEHQPPIQAQYLLANPVHTRFLPVPRCNQYPAPHHWTGICAFITDLLYLIYPAKLLVMTECSHGARCWLDQPQPRRIALAIIGSIFFFLDLAPSHDFKISVRRVQAKHQDNWTLHQSDRDRSLPRKRFEKLLVNPFDRSQWRSLLRSEGKNGLGRRIDQARVRQPSPKIEILHARWLLEDHNPNLAADTLTAILQNNNLSRTLRDRTLDLQVHALTQSKQWPEAVTSLVNAAKSSPHQKKAKSRLVQALQIAKKYLPIDRAHAIAIKLSRSFPDRTDFQIEVAQTAYSLGKLKLARETFDFLLQKSTKRSRYSIIEKHAELASQHQKFDLAADLYWSLLKSSHVGSRDQRSTWWVQCLNSHVQSENETLWLEELKSKIPTDFSHEPEAWATLAKLFERQGQANSSIKAWQNAIGLAPLNSIYTRALIGALETDSQFSAAVNQLRVTKQIDYDLVEHSLDLADRLIVNGERQLGLEIASVLFERAGADLQTLNRLIDFYNAQSLHDQALRVAQDQIRRFPRHIDARIALGEQLYQQGLFDDAIFQWQFVPKLTHPKSIGWLRLAEILGEHADHQRKLWTPAFDALDKAQKLAPRDPQILRLRAVFEESRQREDLALDIWQEIYWQSHTPRFQFLHDEARTRTVELLVSASLSHKSQRRRNIHETCVKAIQSSDTDRAKLAVRLLAEFHIRVEDYQAASTAYRSFFANHESDNSMRIAWAAAERRAGHSLDARKILEDVLEEEPSQLKSLASLLTELSFETGNYEEAKSLAQSVSSKDRGGIDALMHLAKLQYDHGNIPASMNLLDEILQIDPVNKSARQRLAEIYLHKNQLKKAATLYSAITRNFTQQAPASPATVNRSLDLANVTGQLFELLDQCLFQAQVPQATPLDRERLLSALEHLGDKQLETWFKSSPPSTANKMNRSASLRITLLAALQRDSVGSRLRAANLLGRLALPKSGPSLARIGAYFDAPADSPRAIQDAYAAVRIASLRAHARVDESESIPTLTAILQNSRESSEIRSATIWSLAASRHAEAHRTLVGYLRFDQTPLDLTILCVAIALHGVAYPDSVRVTLDKILERSENGSTQAACQLARASMTKDENLPELDSWFRSLNPQTTAIAAWRAGRAKSLRPQTWEDLFTLILGAPGIAQRTATAAIYQHNRALATSPTSHQLPFFHHVHWTDEFQGWLLDVIAPPHPNLEAKHIEPHCKAWHVALAQANAGSQRQRFWVNEQKTQRSVLSLSEVNRNISTFCQH